MSDAIKRVLAENPDLAADLYLIASEIVEGYEDSGPVLLANEEDEYDETTAIVRLQALRDELVKAMGAIEGGGAAE